MRRRAYKEITLLQSQRKVYPALQTVCLALGPYRNLTTLTAALLALHPHCQVLNHGGIHILGDRRLDFLAHYSDRRFDRFTRAAIELSRHGRRGEQGGSILLSHAFDPQYQTHHLYQQRFGAQRVKPEIQVLFWKESLRITNYLHNQAIDLAAIFSQNPKLKFLLPVRHPLDCALSNIRTGYAKKLRTCQRNASIEQVVGQVLDEFLWVYQQSQQHPGRFLIYFEHEFSEKTVVAIADFLGVTADVQWRQDALALFTVARTYQHSPELIETYRTLVRQKFAEYPIFADQLLQFVPNQDATLSCHSLGNTGEIPAAFASDK